MTYVNNDTLLAHPYSQMWTVRAYWPSFLGPPRRRRHTLLYWHQVYRS